MLVPPTNLNVTWPPLGDPHGYFDWLSQRSDVLHAYSMRDNQKLLDWRAGKALPPDVTYSYPNDPDPRQQDAAKVLVPFRFDTTMGHLVATSIRNQCRPPIDFPAGSHRSLFATWDYWMGGEWVNAHTSMGNSKQFNLFNSGDASYMLTQSTFADAVPGTIALFTIRGKSPDSADSTITPLVNRYVYAERWCRVWRLAIPHPTEVMPDGSVGCWHMWVWWADEQQEPTLVYSDVRQQFPSAGEGFGHFGVEYATSQNYWNLPHIIRPTPSDLTLCAWCGYRTGEKNGTVNHTDYDRGQLVSYVRNIVLLLDLAPSDVTPLLQKP